MGEVALAYAAWTAIAVGVGSAVKQDQDRKKASGSRNSAEEIKRVRGDEINKEESEAIADEQQRERIRKQNRARKASANKTKGRAGTVLTTSGAPAGATTGSSTTGGSTGATKTKLGM